jgi:4'-phosphopantetheinyl transferase EntD
MANEQETTVMLSKILPTAMACSEQIGTPMGSLLLHEARLLGPRTVSTRRQEFAAGRSCARAALGLLGVPQSPILQGQHREPLWPVGAVGSITHCEGYCAAAVASEEDYASIGIDAEPNEPLPAGVLELIAVGAERAWIQDAPQGVVCWDRLLFSIKESIYKTWFPMEQCWLNFDQAVVEVDPRTSTFKAAILHPTSLFPGVIEGNYLVTNSLLLTCTWILPSAHRVSQRRDRICRQSV